MTTPQSLTDDIEDAVLGLAPYALAAAALALGLIAAAIALILQPAWLAQLQSSLAGVEPKAYWYLSRSSAIVSYIMLWGSMVLGLAITNKLARAWPGGPTFAALHEHTSWLGLILAIFHGLILLGDHYIGYSLPQVLLPFASTSYRPLWVGLGQISLYLLAIVVASFYVRRWLSYRAWRTLHYAGFGVFALALLHGVFSGTDSGIAWISGMYWASALSVVGLTVYRIRLARAKRAATAQRSLNRAAG
ncbi:MAG: ferric reductase-like transmembrane domain-containing protein [Anaerolineales bacterium]